MSLANTSRIGLLVLFTISGFAGLIYESIWSHYLKLFLGHSAYAQTLVLSIFMGGMAAGAWWIGRRSRHLPNLLLGYAIVEAVIGLFALVFHRLFQGVSGWMFDSVIPELDSPALIAGVKWTLGALLILPQSILLGATFPLMSGAIVRRAPERSGQTLALLYFTNSLGAALGVLVSGFLLIGKIGLPGTILTAGVLNLLLAVVVWAISKSASETLPSRRGENDATAVKAVSGLERIILVGAFATGAAAFMYEIAWIRMLSLVLGSSTHAFELMLSAFILGIALGGYWIRNRIQHLESPLKTLGFVMLIMATVALVTLHLYNTSFDWMAAVTTMFTATDAGYKGFHVGSHLIALILMVPTTVFCGMTLPIMTNMLIGGAAGERAIGAVYAWNTLGAIAGIVMAVHVLMPLLGVKGLMIVGATIHACLGAFFLMRGAVTRLPAFQLLAPAVAVVAILSAVFVVQLDPRRMTSGVFRHGAAEQSADATVTFFEHGKTASISLAESGGAVTIATNGKPDASIQMRPDRPALDDEVTMVAAAALPLSMHPAPRLIANIGIGSGLTSHVLLADPGVELLDTIEIEPVMAQAARIGYLPRVRNAFEDPRSHLHFADAKTFFASQKQLYDVIVSEPSNPWVSGVASLFSAEFYDQLVGYLQPDGLFVQWLQIYETDSSTVTSVLKALAPRFADFALYKADDSNLLVIATKAGRLPAMTDRIFGIAAMRAELERVNISGLRDLESRFVGNRDLVLPALQVSGIPENSDYFPWVDQNAIRARILKRNALEITALSVDPTATLDLLLARPGPTAPPAVRREHYLEFDGVASRATAIFDVIAHPNHQAAPELLREIEFLSVPASRCVEPGVARAWLDAVFKMARATTPALGSGQLRELWDELSAKPCVTHLAEGDAAWLRFLQAVALRQGDEVANLGEDLLRGDYVFGSRMELAYAAQATISAQIARGNASVAGVLLQSHLGDMAASGVQRWTLELLRGLVLAPADARR